MELEEEDSEDDEEEDGDKDDLLFGDTRGGQVMEEAISRNPPTKNHRKQKEPKVEENVS
jgi:hypothetical protein